MPTRSDGPGSPPSPSSRATGPCCRPSSGSPPAPRAALNLYAHDAGVFDEHARILAGLFGAQAALLFYGAENAGHLQRAVDSRDLIGQAKGIIMERFTLDDDGAFALLVQSSQETNMKLVEVARWLVSEVVGRRAHGAKATATTRE